MIIAYFLSLLSIYITVALIYKLLDKAGYIKREHRWLTEGATTFLFILLIMQSAGQLTMRDILALIPLAWLAYFYFGYTSNTNKSDV